MKNISYDCDVYVCKVKASLLNTLFTILPDYITEHEVIIYDPLLYMPNCILLSSSVYDKIESHFSKKFFKGVLSTIKLNDYIAHYTVKHSAQLKINDEVRLMHDGEVYVISQICTDKEHIIIKHKQYDILMRVKVDMLQKL